jgi:hypothetical protein
MGHVMAMRLFASMRRLRRSFLQESLSWGVGVSARNHRRNGRNRRRQTQPRSATASDPQRVGNGQTSKEHHHLEFTSNGEDLKAAQEFASVSTCVSPRVQKGRKTLTKPQEINRRQVLKTSAPGSK